MEVSTSSTSTDDSEESEEDDVDHVQEYPDEELEDEEGEDADKKRALLDLVRVSPAESVLFRLAVPEAGAA